MKKTYLWGLALKNLTRYKRRTIITVLVLAVGISCYILIDSLLIGARRDSETNLIIYEMGDGKLVTPAYWEDWKDRPIDECIENPDRIIKELDKIGVPAVKRIEFTNTATLKTGVGGTFPILVTAIDMEEDTKVLQVIDALSEGRLPEKEEDGAIIGEWMAQDMGLAIGDILDLKITDRWGSQDGIELEIVGLINSTNAEVNRQGFYISLDTADYYLDMEGAVTQLVLDLPLLNLEKRSALAAIEELTKEYNLEYHPWQDWSQDYIAMSDGDKYSSFVILLLVFIIASVGVANTMLMTVMERQREIGMMRSLGMSDRSVRRLFLSEAMIIGFIGSLLGILLGALGNIPMVEHGIDYSEMMRDFSVGYRSAGIIRGVWTPTSYIYSLIGGVLICLFVSFFTVKKLMHRPITEEIRAN